MIKVEWIDPCKGRCERFYKDLSDANALLDNLRAVGLNPKVIGGY